jgi:serine/threonine-protein kinase
VLQERGAFGDAIASLNDAVELQAAQPPTSADLMETLNQLANTYYYAGELERSDSLNRVILERDRELWGDRHPTVADDLINLGVIQFDRGNYAEAEPYLRQALDIFLAYHGAEHPQTASNMTILARTLIFLPDRDDEALQLLERSLVTRERLFGPVHPGVASTLNELGSLALRRKDYDAAEAYFTRMAEIYRATRGEDHYLVAIALSNRATVYLNREQFAAAEPMFRDVIARMTRALSAEHINTGIAHVKLGRTLTGLARFAEAEGHLTTGYAILMKQTNPSVPWLQSARTDLIKVYDALGEPDKAERYRRELAQTQAGAAARPGS